MPEDTDVVQDGQEPIVTVGAANQTAVLDKEALPNWAQKELEKARSEAADRRVKLREAQAQLDELKPLAEQFKQQTEAQKSEEQKLRDQLEAMKAEAQNALAAADLAKKEAKLALMASKAGVDADLVALLDLSKLDLDDEEATLNTLKKLTTRSTTGGGPSNPANKTSGVETPAEWYAKQTGKRPSIFGG